MKKRIIAGFTGLVFLAYTALTSAAGFPFQPNQVLNAADLNTALQTAAITSGTIDSARITNSPISGNTGSFTGLTSPSVSLTGGLIDNIPIGTTTPVAGSFTNLISNGTVSGTGFSTYLASPPAIGGTTPNTGRFTSLTATGTATVNVVSAVSATITGGTIDNTVIGSGVPAVGTFTTLSASSAVTVTSASSVSIGGVNLASSGGASIIGFLPAGASAVSTTVQNQVNSIIVQADNFKQPGDADDLLSIQRALNYAYTLTATRVLQNGVFIVPYGGAIVDLSAKNYVTTSGTIEIPVGVILRGKGVNQSSITSSFNGQIIRNADGTAAGVYGYSNGGLTGLTIYGDRTKTSQIGVDLLRLLTGSTFSNVVVTNTGGTGVMIRECIGFKGDNVTSSFNVGRGFFFDQGVSTWAGMVADGLPSNASNFTNSHALMNDAAGVGFGIANRNTFSGVSEYNYHSTAPGAGYNVDFVTSAQANRFTGWLEGPVLASVFSNTTGLGQINYVDNGYFTPSGSATTGPSRAVIATVGTVEINGYYGLNSAWPTINGSAVPFRCTKGGTGGRIVYRGQAIFGSPSNGIVIEDENGNQGNYALYAYQETQNGSNKISYNFANEFFEAGQIQKSFFRTTAPASSVWETTPWLRFNNFLQGVEFDSGSAGHYAGVYYRSSSPEGAVTAYPGSLAIVGAGSNANTFQKASGISNTGWLPIASTKTGSFTYNTTTATFTVADTAVLAATSKIMLMPTNAAAAALMNGTNSLYISAKTANTSFTVSTGAGGNAAGTETFDYIIVN